MASIRRAEEKDLPRIVQLESENYPESEAATPEKLRHRLERAGEFFVVAENEQGGLLGFACGTLARGERLTEESMSEHDPQGSTLCLHSVVVEPGARRKGVGSELVGEFVKAGERDERVERVRLISKEDLVHFYEGVGLVHLGQSPVQHGGSDWIEMGRDFHLH